MTTLTEGRHAGEFILSEAEGALSREVASLASGEDLPAGAILEKVSGSFAGGDMVVTGFTGTTSAEAIGVLLAAVDATDGALPCVVIARNAEVNANMLSVESDNTAEDQKTAGIVGLASLNVIAR